MLILSQTQEKGPFLKTFITQILSHFFLMIQWPAFEKCFIILVSIILKLPSKRRPTREEMVGFVPVYSAVMTAGQHEPPRGMTHSTPLRKRPSHYLPLEEMSWEDLRPPRATGRAKCQ